MDILDLITHNKRKEVAKKKELYPTKLLEQSLHFEAPVVSMRKYLLRPDKTGIIAEFKRKSPSKEIINAYAKVEDVTVGYMQSGCAGLSVLTDTEFFGGSNNDLKTARKYNFCPILRKDFIMDEYQIIESRSIGADTILLIAECLEKKEVEQLAKFAKSLGLEVLMEVHSEDQLSKLNPYIDIVGINNRDLKTFKVSIKNSLELIKVIPDDFLKISESGISQPASILELRAAGFNGFLIGETFMKSSEPARACREFIQSIEQLDVQKSTSVDGQASSDM